MKTVYFDCINGAAGDMILAALIDAGVPERVPNEAVASLDIGASDISVEWVKKGAIRASSLLVTFDAPVARNYRDIVALLEVASLDDGIRTRALAAFELLASAEAKIHDIPDEDVHFHEIGSVDAIVDIVGACAALEHLAPERVLASPVPTGRGLIDSRHGTIPVPAPAVTEILKDGVLYERGDVELVTPTGAALLASWCETFGEMPPLRIESVGYGAGRCDTEVPNVLRVLVGEQLGSATAAERTELIETNVDDMAPELLPYVIERLIGAGALDAWVTPILMKKGRTAMTLSVLTDPTRTNELLDVLFAETTTLGVRIAPTDRVVLVRKEETVQVEGHTVRVKLGIRNGRIVTVAPAYEDAVAAARATEKPLKDVYKAAQDAAARFV